MVEANMRTMANAVQFIETLRSLDPEFSLNSALILLHVARKPGVGLKELTNLLGVGKSSVSRHVASLSEEIDGHGLVTFKEDMTDRRNKQVRLTPNGVRLVNKLLSFTQGGPKDGGS